MTEPTYLFVYGTLRKDFFLPLREKIATDIQWMDYAKIKGQLFNIGEYPGAVPHHVGYIHGEIIKVLAPQKVFRILDDYEGYKQGAEKVAEYRRKKEIAEMENGTFVNVWIYWYNFPLGSAERIRGSDYLNYLKKNQLA